MEGKSEHFRDRSHFHGCADDDYQVDYSGIVLGQSVEEAVGKFFAKESDVWLNKQSVCEYPRIKRDSPSSHQAGEHHNGHHLPNQSGSISTLTCRWKRACVCAVAFRSCPGNSGKVILVVVLRLRRLHHLGPQFGICGNLQWPMSHGIESVARAQCRQRLQCCRCFGCNL